MSEQPSSNTNLVRMLKPFGCCVDVMKLDFLFIYKNTFAFLRVLRVVWQCQSWWRMANPPTSTVAVEEAAEAVPTRQAPLPTFSVSTTPSLTTITAATTTQIIIIITTIIIWSSPSIFCHLLPRLWLDPPLATVARTWWEAPPGLVPRLPRLRLYQLWCIWEQLLRQPTLINLDSSNSSSNSSNINSSSNNNSINSWTILKIPCAQQHTFNTGLRRGNKRKIVVNKEDQ